MTRSQALVFASVFLLVLSGLPFLPTSQAATSNLSSYTTPLTLTWAQNFTTRLHIDVPPSPFTFYPNGTVNIANSQTVFLSWGVTPIPLQAPSSFQANSSYVAYSLTGPAGASVTESYAQEKVNGLWQNSAAVGFSSSTLKSGTISILFKAYGSQLLAFNSTGGISGTLCDLKLSSIEWDFCPGHSAESNVVVSYSAGSLKLAITAAPWSWESQSIALDGSASSSDVCQGVSSCTVSLTTATSGDEIIVAMDWTWSDGCSDTTSPAVSSSPSLTWTERQKATAECSIFGSISWDSANWTSSGSISITMTAPAGQTINHNAMIAFGVSNSSNTFDPDAIWSGNYTGTGCPSSGGKYEPCVRSVTTANANDFFFTIAATGGDSGSDTGTAGATGSTSATLIDTTAPWGNSFGVQYAVLSATLSSATTNFGVYTGLGFQAWGDAIMQASSGGTTTTTTTTSTSSTSSTASTTGGSSISGGGAPRPYCMLYPKAAICQTTTTTTKSNESIDPSALLGPAVLIIMVGVVAFLELKSRGRTLKRRPTGF